LKNSHETSDNAILRLRPEPISRDLFNYLWSICEHAEIADIEREAKRAVEALPREIAAEEPESFEDHRGELERLRILVRYDSRTREAESEGRFNLLGVKNCCNGVDGYVNSFSSIPFKLKRRVACKPVTL
jgi:hypothetical protein